MAQKLYVKERGTGGVVLKEVHVLRSWQESDGRQIFLHHNGTYGYKGGAPVMSADEFNIIGDPTQRKMAMVWWNKKGKDLSAGYYDRVNAEIEKQQMEGLPMAAFEESSDLDSIMYMRRPLKDKRRKAFSEPSTWPEFEFPTRPDWWGHAGVIELGIYRYEKVEPEEEPEDSQEPESDEDRDSQDSQEPEGSF